ncbi:MULTISPECIES: RebB family R body protein [Azorhizobium]|uniref:RebD1 protein n=1 Tax=Azorhizobium caulinodans (strain ATCC 43989 / DSM 5975 / JCM 20966 / LMG 6465 / NBRC 14845 / NCIMB 13405 / ORS 571) TaxID=438753 RepID=A8INR9_AZOC5|nr:MULTISPECIES: RebB family R body protein [Azorhizobium]TDU00912.1 killing trait domain-containing protein [Azorhizobium sp. AG788]BAF89779.1 RebD1 protein [Azorhizobium caulinodans ORS 571]
MSTTGSDGPITDSVAASSESVLGSAAPVALSMFYQAAGQAYAITMQNAASNQHNLNGLNLPLVSNAVKALTTK